MDVVDRQVRTDAVIKGLTASVNELITGDGGRAWTEGFAKIVTESVDRRHSTATRSSEHWLFHLV